jgi:hypothetical protein
MSRQKGWFNELSQEPSPNEAALVPMEGRAMAARMGAHVPAAYLHPTQNAIKS